MGEVIVEAFRLYNLPFSVLLILVLLFWGSVILGFLDIESLDLDFGNIGEYFSLGKIPFSVWLSIFAIQVWFYAVMMNYVINQTIPLHNLFRLLAAVLVIMPISGFLTRLFASPIAKLFREYEDQYANLVGKSCLVTSSKVDRSFGTAEIKTDGSPLLINIQADEKDLLMKGDEALIIEYDSVTNTYLVSRF